MSAFYFIIAFMSAKICVTVHTQWQHFAILLYEWYSVFQSCGADEHFVRVLKWLRGHLSRICLFCILNFKLLYTCCCMYRMVCIHSVMRWTRWWSGHTWCSFWLFYRGSSMSSFSSSFYSPYSTGQSVHTSIILSICLSVCLSAYVCPASDTACSLGYRKRIRSVRRPCFSLWVSSK